MPAPQRPREPKPPVVSPTLGPNDLGRAWSLLAAALPVAERTMLTEVALPVAIREGLLQIAVKKDTWRGKVRDVIGRIDLAAIIPGIRRVEVEVSHDAGPTGREVRTEAEESRRRVARADAEAHAVIRQLLKIFDAEIESVEPLGAVPVEEANAVEADIAEAP